MSFRTRTVQHQFQHLVGIILTKTRLLPLNTILCFVLGGFFVVVFMIKDAWLMHKFVYLLNLRSNSARVAKLSSYKRCPTGWTIQQCQAIFSADSERSEPISDWLNSVWLTKHQLVFTSVFLCFVLFLQSINLINIVRVFAVEDESNQAFDGVHLLGCCRSASPDEWWLRSRSVNQVVIAGRSYNARSIQLHSTGCVRFRRKVMSRLCEPELLKDINGSRLLQFLLNMLRAY